MRVLTSKLKRIVDMEPGIIGILYVYRYTSWLFTSIFYLTLYKGASLGFKLIVIVSLLIAAKVVTDIYVKYSDNYSLVEITILTETVGILLLLVPTAGISSPFMWYALNPVLVAACFLAPYFCWINLGFYLLSSALISYFFFLRSTTLSELLYDNLYLILVFALITMLVQFLSLLTKRLKWQTCVLTYQKDQLETVNNELSVSNQRYQQSIDHIMSLYKIVEAFNSSVSINKLLNAFAEYALDLTKAQSAFLWLCPSENRNRPVISYSAGGREAPDEAIYSNELEKCWESLLGKDRKDIFSMMLDEKEYKASLIETPSQTYGLIAVSGCESEDENQLTKLMVFLANLCSVIVERHHLENMADRFMIIEEQNRIANEIHDNVSQRLFSIICKIAALTGGKSGEGLSDEVIDQLELIREASNSAMQELRASIYRLSSRKNGEVDFITSIENYLNNFAKLNNIELKVNFSGDEANLSSQKRNYIYRIIRETSGNAVRHGRCTELSVTLEIRSQYTRLVISDNGDGFDIKKVNKQYRKGLGLYNIRSMTEAMGGELEINSGQGNGTEITVLINQNANNSDKGDIA